jgi:mRNA-degrading endonuclease YafQ of YafQ-DinJ toxin-antitoxin module
MVEFKKTKLFDKTFKGYKNQKVVIDKFKDFTKTKELNPSAQYGASDKPFVGILAPYKHAHLSNDVSVIYSTSGKDPTVITLYALASHDETGTGQPSSPKLMNQFRSKLDNQ